MANEYLKRTPTSTGNRKVFTWSGWVKTTKESKSGNGNDIFFCASSNNAATYHRTRVGKFVQGDNDFGFNHYDGANDNYASNADFRDFSSWSHYLCSVDTTKEVGTDRVKLYVNGVLISDLQTVTAINKNLNTFVNGLTVHYIGADGWNVTPNTIAKLGMVDAFLVDGQALTPDVFGYYKKGDGYISAGSVQATDFKKGQWVPKAPKVIKSVINARGGFGVNGFYLPMNDDSNFGADFHCEPNSIIKLKGEDFNEYPQPRNGAPTTTDAYVSQLRTDPYAANLVLAVPGIALENTNTELVTNGTFDTGISGWTGYNSTPTWDSLNQRLAIDAPTEFDGAETSSGISVSANTNYTLSLDIFLGTAGGVRIQIRDSANAAGTLPTVDIDVSGSHTINFNSLSNTSVYLRLISSGGNTGTAYFDNISIKEAVPVRDYSADIKGSGTNKTLTAVGNAGVGYEIPSYYGSSMQFDNDGTNGSGNTDVINVPTSSDFVFSGDVTMECWFYPTGTPSVASCILGQWRSGGGTDRNFNINFDTSNRVIAYFNSSATNYNTGTSPGLALNQWHHIAAEKHGSNFTLYVNGVAVGLNASTPTAGNTSTVPFTIGSESDGSNAADYGVNGYIQDVRVYKGVAKYKSGFDVPKPYTPVGIESWRAVPDTTANNFATINPLGSGAGTFTDGSLTYNSSSDTGNANIGISTGNFYYEGRVTNASPNNGYIGIMEATEQNPLRGGGWVSHGAIAYKQNGEEYFKEKGSAGSTSSSYGDSYTTGDIIGIACDVTNNTVTFYKNGVSQGTTSQGPSSIQSNGTFTPLFYGSTVKWNINFGQNPTFSGNTTAGTYTDSNGKGLFKYEPPSGFLALCEDNLPTPAIKNPGEHFKTVLWTGDGAARSITGIGFTPDLVWIKRRTETADHRIFDSVRGPAKILYSNSTAQENPDTSSLTSFDDDGFSAVSDYGTNGNGGNFVAWCWKAGGAAVENTDGSITSQVSANQTAGFSIVSYTGDGSDANRTVGHGLGKTPTFIIVKARDEASRHWLIWHNAYSNDEAMLFNTGTPAGSRFGPDAPTSNVFGVYGGQGNRGTTKFISYCWTEIEGFSKFGSYVGNGDPDGSFVYCGFKPAWVMIKQTNDVNNWHIADSSRKSINPVNMVLRANLSNIESPNNTSFDIDFVSNGFKLRSTNDELNEGSSTYIFAAFAESPFTTANAK